MEFVRFVKCSSLVACVVAVLGLLGCGKEGSSSEVSTPTEHPGPGQVDPTPAVELGLELQHAVPGGTQLVLTAEVTDDGRYPGGSAVEASVLLVGTLEGDVGSIALDLGTLPAEGSVELAELDFDQDVLSLAASSDWFVVRAEVNYVTGGMSVATTYLTRGAAGFEATTREAFDAAADE